MKRTPLIKWPGGKRLIVPRILPLIPPVYGRYFEPFFGGGALFFQLKPKIATLSDINEDLINCYVQVRDNPEGLIEILSQMENTSDNYYHVRASRPQDKLAKAARFIYLITLSFNGIYRQNLKGVFNVPYGGKTHILPCNAELLRSVSLILSNIEISRGDFGSNLKSAKQGDLIYLDPPYTVAHGNNGFIKYNAKIFSWDDQIRLATLANKLSEKGCYVVISNADHDSIKSLYKNFDVEIVSRVSLIAASGQYRRQITECIFHNGGKI